MPKILGFTVVTLHGFVDSRRNRPFSVFPFAPAQCNLLLVFHVMVLIAICWCLMARNRHGIFVLVSQVHPPMPSFPWLSPVSVCGSSFAFFLHWMKTLKELGYCHDLEVSILTSILWVGKGISGTISLLTKDVGVFCTFLPAFHWKHMVEPLICVTQLSLLVAFWIWGISLDHLPD